MLVNGAKLLGAYSNVNATDVEATKMMQRESKSETKVRAYVKTKYGMFTSKVGARARQRATICG